MVLVGVLGRRIHEVDVQVDGRLHHPQPGDARLLDGLPERHTGEVGITVGVPAGLEPAPQLGVEQDQDPAVRRIHDQRRARQVPRATGPVEGVGPGVQEFQNPVLLRTDRSGLDGVPGIVDLSSGQVGQVGGRGSRAGGPGTHVAVPAHPPRWARMACGGTMGSWSPTDTPT